MKIQFVGQDPTQEYGKEFQLRDYEWENLKRALISHLIFFDIGSYADSIPRPLNANAIRTIEWEEFDTWKPDGKSGYSIQSKCLEFSEILHEIALYKYGIDDYFSEFAIFYDKYTGKECYLPDHEHNESYNSLRCKIMDFEGFVRQSGGFVMDQVH